MEIQRLRVATLLPVCCQKVASSGRQSVMRVVMGGGLGVQCDASSPSSRFRRIALAKPLSRWTSP